MKDLFKEKLEINTRKNRQRLGDMRNNRKYTTKTDDDIEG